MRLGKIPHPYTGIRLPDVLLEGILNSYKANSTAGTLGLSFGRETALEEVVNTHGYPTLGHTGTSIKEYLTKARRAAQEKDVVIELEADHLIIGSSSMAVKRIAGTFEKKRISEEEIKSSIGYNKKEIDEALSTDAVDFFTIDASALFDQRGYSEDRFRRLNLVGKYETPAEKRCAIKFAKAIDVMQDLYEYISRKKENFGFEISLDETKERTAIEEMDFVLKEWRERGLNVDFVAPNVGFRKRTDFTGDLIGLEEHIIDLNSIARRHGSLLCFHSGSGTSPYSGKGKGTYEALLKATNKKLKYKISGVYIELIFELLSKSRHRGVFERAYNDTLGFLREEIKNRGELATEEVKEQVKNAENKSEKSPGEEFFRFNSYLALNFRDESGKRYIREGIINAYKEDEIFKELVDKEVEALTSRLIEGLNFQGNARYLKT